MGQRPALLNFTDPSEGRKFILDNPVGYRKNGKPIYLIAGGSGEDDDDDDDDTSGVNTDGSTVPIGRFLKVQNRMKAADRRANDLQAKLTASEEVAAKVPELEKQVEGHASTIQQLRLDNAFLASSDITWHNPEDALRLADLSKVKFSEDGKVEGLADALKELAEKRPYLVKKDEVKKGKADSDGDDEDDDDESDDEDDTDDQDDDDNGASGKRVDVKNGQQGGGVSGTSTGSGKRKRKTKGPTDEELMRLYRI